MLSACMYGAALELLSCAHSLCVVTGFSKRHAILLCIFLYPVWTLQEAIKLVTGQFTCIPGTLVFNGVGATTSVLEL